MGQDSLWRSEFTVLRDQFRERVKLNLWLEAELWPSDKRVVESEAFPSYAVGTDGGRTIGNRFCRVILAYFASDGFRVYTIGNYDRPDTISRAVADDFNALARRSAEALCRCPIATAAGVSEGTLRHGATAETWLLAIFEVLNADWDADTLAARGVRIGPPVDEAINEQVVKWRCVENVYLESVILIENLLNATTENQEQAPLNAGSNGESVKAKSRLLSVYTSGVTDQRIQQAEEILGNDNLIANEKLTKIDALFPFPATTSSQTLGELLGVTKAAVQKTEWWAKNRKGKDEDRIGRRRKVHRERAKQIEPDGSVELDE